jgi:ribosome-binding protein aMBF1 (putative translation factor)
MLGTLRESCSKEHRGYYVDEYAFSFNRRKSNGGRLSFDRLVQNAVYPPPISYDKIAAQWRIPPQVYTHIKLFRFYRALSQADLAEKAGISITFLSDIERDNK